MDEKSRLEKISSGLPVNIAANTVGVLGATITPLAAFVPFLVQTLASRRQSERLGKMLGELEVLLQQQAEKLKEITDDQYKLVNEAIAAAFYTVDEQKLEILKHAIEKAIDEPDIAEASSDALSRVIRDISVVEAKFFGEHFLHPKFSIREEDISGGEIVSIRSEPSVVITVSGLLGMGLIYSPLPHYGPTVYQWTPLAEKLARLLK